MRIMSIAEEGLPECLTRPSQYICLAKVWTMLGEIFQKEKTGCIKRANRGHLIPNEVWSNDKAKQGLKDNVRQLYQLGMSLMSCCILRTVRGSKIEGLCSQ